MKRLLAARGILLLAGATCAFGALHVGCIRLRSAAAKPAPLPPVASAAQVAHAPVPAVIPTKVVQTGTLKIPGDPGTISKIDCHDGKLYISSEADSSGLHCFNMADQKQLWSVHLADYQHHGCAEGVNKQATAYSLAYSADNRTLFAGVSGEGTCNPMAIKLVALDMATGRLMSELEDSEYRKLTTASVGGREILIAVGATNVLILDQADLKTVLLDYQMPHTTPDPQDFESQILLAAPGCSAWDGANGVLYVGMPLNQHLTRLALEPADRQWRYQAQSIKLADAPHQLLLLPERG